MTMRAAFNSLDPLNTTTRDNVALGNVSRLVFDSLVTLDDTGKPQPSLAIAWQEEPGSLRWTFTLRDGVVLHNGSRLTPQVVASSLRTANPEWKVLATGNMVIVESSVPRPDLPVVVALPRNGIALRDGNKLVGTGPFAINDWQPGKKLTLAARDDYWGGRPFVDAIEIEVGRNPRDQMIALDLGRADLTDVLPEQAHRALAEGRYIASSAPLELVALNFQKERLSEDDGKLRQALALSIDRNSLNNVILQGAGESAGGLLPNWLSGYGFLFPIQVDLRRARELRDSVSQRPIWTLGYDNGDPTTRLLAERIALNARDAGLSLQPTIAANPDIRLVTIPIASVDARIALSSMTAQLGLKTPPIAGSSVNDLYQAESSVLATQRVIPLLHLRVNYGLGPMVKNWTRRVDGSWNLPDVWLGASKP